MVGPIKLRNELAEDDAIYVDTENGVAGTDPWLGKPTQPVNNLVDALVLATIRHLRKIKIRTATAGYSFPTGVQNYLIEGYGYENTILNLNDQDVSNNTFKYCELTGSAAGKAITAIECVLEDLTNFSSEHVERCQLRGTITPGNHRAIFWDCYTEDLTYIDLTSFVDTIYFFASSGVLSFTNMTLLGEVVIHGHVGAIDVNASCTNGHFQVHGENCSLSTVGSTSIVNDYRVKTLVNKLPVEGETTLADSDNGGMEANIEYYWIEVVNDTGIIKVYEYNFTSSVPSETQDRVQIMAFGSYGLCWDSNKIVLDINKAASGLYTRMGGSAKAYLYFKYYEPTNSAWKLIKPVVLLDKATDTLMSTPPVDTDFGEVIIFDDFASGSKIIGMLYVDTAITSQVDLPFELVLKRGGNTV